jgi:MoxR-like ATPase
VKYFASNAFVGKIAIFLGESLQCLQLSDDMWRTRSLPLKRDPSRVTVTPLEATDKDVELLAKLARGKDLVLEQVSHRIIGQKEVLEGIMTATVSGGHALLVGVPGLAKTLMVSTLAEALSLDFSRIQFTPDLMPSDITGTEIIEEDPTTGKRAFRFVHGPVFANVVLADEINRTPPKTQAALLQAMQEHEVTASGQTFNLPEPFFVLATQNPIEQEGTYPLPEAQLDRFMLELKVDYPARHEEERIAEETTGDAVHPVQAVLSADDLLEMQHLVRRIPAPKTVVKAAVLLSRMTRPTDEDAPAFIKEYVDWGAGPRASQYLVLGAKARAALDGRPMADLDDVKTVALSVLRHRIGINFAAEAAARSSEDICEELVDQGTWMRGES